MLSASEVGVEESYTQIVLLTIQILPTLTFILRK